MFWTWGGLGPTPSPLTQSGLLSWRRPLGRHWRSTRPCRTWTWPTRRWETMEQRPGCRSLGCFPPFSVSVRQFQALAEGLIHNASLTHLNLEKNRIEHGGVQASATAAEVGGVGFLGLGTWGEHVLPARAVQCQVVRRLQQEVLPHFYK